ncbi:unnamed protein product [Symbiodinium natans]|uniref:Uncharacterized protein n=1 Tax=Symbiodinium natans TaxID=878477 RepID=A0A812LUN9_9DINO|nr:unnamed protein product [Symbiodinium natans]
MSYATARIGYNYKLISNGTMLPVQTWGGNSSFVDAVSIFASPTSPMCGLSKSNTRLPLLLSLKCHLYACINLLFCSGFSVAVKGCVAEMGTIGKLLQARTVAYIDCLWHGRKAVETLRRFLLVCPLTSYANAGLPEVILANLARPHLWMDMPTSHRKALIRAVNKKRQLRKAWLCETQLNKLKRCVVGSALVLRCALRSVSTSFSFCWLPAEAQVLQTDSLQ